MGFSNEILLAALSSVMRGKVQAWLLTKQRRLSSWKPFVDDFSESFIHVLDDEDLWTSCVSVLWARGRRLRNLSQIANASSTSLEIPLIVGRSGFLAGIRDLSATSIQRAGVSWQWRSSSGMLKGEKGVTSWTFQVASSSIQRIQGAAYKLVKARALK